MVCNNLNCNTVSGFPYSVSVNVFILWMYLILRLKMCLKLIIWSFKPKWVLQWKKRSKMALHSSLKLYLEFFGSKSKLDSFSSSFISFFWVNQFVLNIILENKKQNDNLCKNHFIFLLNAESEQDEHLSLSISQKKFVTKMIH